METFAAKPAASIPEACDSWSETCAGRCAAAWLQRLNPGIDKSQHVKDKGRENAA
jgi:hypothetical protein